MKIGLSHINNDLLIEANNEREFKIIKKWYNQMMKHLEDLKLTQDN
jgi:hypothetical protein